MTETVEFLKSHLSDMSDDAVFFERMQLLLEAEREHRNDSNGDKYVACIAKLLENMTVDIRERELIVGMCREEILDPAQEAEFARMCLRYNFRATELFSFDPLKIINISDEDERFAPEWFNSYGHCIPDWELLLRKGYSGLAADAKSRLADGALTAEQREFLENAAATAETMNLFIGRYASCAREKSKIAEGGDRARLMKIAEVCESLAKGGAASFYGALQLVWFSMLVLQAVCGARDYAFGRLDQILYPYYRQDTEAGILTREEALELLECLFIKANEIIGYAWEAHQPKRVLCKNSLQYIVVSGMREDGGDATNDVSRLILEAVYELKLKQPTVNVRCHDRIDIAFLDRACEIAASGLGYPSFFNDHTVIPALIASGVPEDKAYGYAYYGCNNNFLPGEEDELRESWHCVPKLLEYALNGGACMATGRVEGAVTPPANRMRGMEDVFSALRLQMADCLRRAKEHVERSDAYWNAMKPFSFESVIMTHCIERASSMNADGALQRHLNCYFVGLATAANSLYAIDRLAFREGKFSLPELVELLKSDWEGEEYTRNYVRERYPKYGNDDASVDRYAEIVAKMFVEEVRKASPAANGRILYPGIYSLWHHRAFGRKCAASADGRKFGEELSESQSPSYNTVANGPTAMFNSVACLPFAQTPCGGLNVKFQPRFFRGDRGYRKLTALLRGYFAKGGMQAMVNVIGRETLEDAVAHPENYKNLLVRVVGYSTYFVSLSPEQQREMIERTEL